MRCNRTASLWPSRLSGAIKLAFLSHPLMRLGSTFNLILKIVAFGWQKLGHFIYAPPTTPTERPCRVTYGLADLEFVAAHGSFLPSITAYPLEPVGRDQ